MTNFIQKIVKAALLFALVSPMIAMADLCPTCQDKMFTSDIGTCKECSKSTSSGAFRLCSPCSKKNQQCEACQAKLEKPADELTLEKLLEAPEEIELGNKRLVLETYIWRNLMPGIDRQSGIIATVTVKTSDKGLIPQGTAVEKIWIVNGSKQWTPAAIEVSDIKDQPTIKVVARNGPAWEAGTNVHVIVKMKDAQGKSFLLKIADQPINAVH